MPKKLIIHPGDISGDITVISTHTYLAAVAMGMPQKKSNRTQHVYYRCSCGNYAFCTAVCFKDRDVTRCPSCSSHNKLQAGVIVKFAQILNYVGRNKHGHHLYNIKCLICGNSKEMTINSITASDYVSCGCMFRKKSTSEPEIHALNTFEKLYPKPEFQWHHHKEIALYRLDIFEDNTRVCVESDGGWWHRDKDRDKARDNNILANGYVKYIIRIPGDTIKHIDKVFELHKQFFDDIFLHKQFPTEPITYLTIP
jgi:very-short-patch-repair endonuclease